MTDLVGKPGELRMTISITRKATGIVENYELVGQAEDKETDAALQALVNGKKTETEVKDGGHS